MHAEGTQPITTPGKLAHKVAIVTGAGSGIGEAIARAFGRAGAAVVVADLNQTRAKKVAEAIELDGGNSLGIKVDVRDDASVKAMIDETLALFGGLHILVNNAGVGKAGYVDEIEAPAWDLILDTNLRSLFLTCHHAIPHLVAQPGGRIINIASVEGIRGTGVTPAYTASKHGVVGLTKSLALALAKKQATVNAICPGFIATRMTRVIVNMPELEQQCKDAIPVGRIGTPEDVANAALFLALPESSFVTGHALVVDGGMTVGAGLELPDRV